MDAAVPIVVPARIAPSPAPAAPRVPATAAAPPIPTTAPAPTTVPTAAPAPSCGAPETRPEAMLGPKMPSPNKARLASISDTACSRSGSCPCSEDVNWEK